MCLQLECHSGSRFHCSGISTDQEQRVHMGQREVLTVKACVRTGTEFNGTPWRPPSTCIVGLAGYARVSNNLITVARYRCLGPRRVAARPTRPLSTSARRADTLYRESVSLLPVAYATTAPCPYFHVMHARMHPTPVRIVAW